MKSGLYTIIEFDDNDKWLVIGETIYKDDKYNYLIKVTPDETDFIADFMTVKCINDGNEEYFDVVQDKDVLKEIMPILMPDIKELANH